MTGHNWEEWKEKEYHVMPTEDDNAARVCPEVVNKLQFKEVGTWTTTDSGWEIKQPLTMVGWTAEAREQPPGGTRSPVVRWLLLEEGRGSQDGCEEIYEPFTSF